MREGGGDGLLVGGNGKEREGEREGAVVLVGARVGEEEGGKRVERDRRWSSSVLR